MTTVPKNVDNTLKHPGPLLYGRVESAVKIQIWYKWGVFLVPPEVMEVGALRPE